MIRHPQRRKKSRVNHGHGCNARAMIVGEECASRSSGCDPKTSEGNKTVRREREREMKIYRIITTQRCDSTLESC